MEDNKSLSMLDMNSLNAIAGGIRPMFPESSEVLFSIQEKATLTIEENDRLNKENDVLRKRITPMKPIPNKDRTWVTARCPSCGKPLKTGNGSSSRYRNNWCNGCGQAILWDEECDGNGNTFGRRPME